jgi:UPF0716 protein FxsA
VIQLNQVRNKVLQGIRPDKEIMSGIITFLSGILFLIPGFLTDFIAIFLLIGPFRSILIRKYSFVEKHSKKQSRKTVIDVDYKEDD